MEFKSLKEDQPKDIIILKKLLILKQLFPRHLKNITFECLINCYRILGMFYISKVIGPTV